MARKSSPKVGDSIPASVVLTHEIAALARKFDRRSLDSHRNGASR